MTKKGDLVTNKMNTAQLMELVKDRDFDPKAQASHRLKGGYRSIAAASLLARDGFDVVNVAGGTQAWIGAGLPIE